jgi:hypothetical protein
MKNLERNYILESLKNNIKQIEWVNAMWECGASSFDRIDEWSDIDIIIDVEDDKILEVFNDIDKIVENISPVERSYGCPQSMSSGAYQKVYKLKNQSEFLLIEICAVKNSSNQKFLVEEIHSKAKIHFDKKNITSKTFLDKNQFNKKIKSRIYELENIFNIYQNLPRKEMNRGNSIEALAFYRSFSLYPLVELIRIKYDPYRYNFKTRYLYYNFPEDIVEKLEELFFISDSKDLKGKHEICIDWFNKLFDELKNKESYL